MPTKITVLYMIVRIHKNVFIRNNDRNRFKVNDNFFELEG